MGWPQTVGPATTDRACSMADRGDLLAALALTSLSVEDFWVRSLALGCDFLDRRRVLAAFDDPFLLSESEAVIAGIVVNERLLELGLPILVGDAGAPAAGPRDLQPTGDVIGISRSLKTASQQIRHASQEARERSRSTRVESVAIRARLLR